MAIETQPTFDDTYSAEIIAKARELSAELDEYVVTQQYLLEASQDEVTPLWLRNKFIIKLIDQLKDFGIFIDASPDQLCDQPIMVQAILFLRAKFDSDRLYDFLKDHEDIKDRILELIGEDEDCVDDIVIYCHEVLPLDEGWDYLENMMNERPGIIYSTDVLVDHITKVCDELDRLGESDPIDDEIRGDSVKFVGYLGNRKQKIMEIAKTIFASTIATEGLEEVQKQSEVRRAMIDQYMGEFEKQLARPNVVKTCVESEHLTDTLNEVRAKYSKMWKHTLEYWCTLEHQHDCPSDMDFAVMFATLYVDAGANNSAKAKVIDVFENAADILGDVRYDVFRSKLDNALANLVIDEEGAMINAAK